MANTTVPSLADLPPIEVNLGADPDLLRAEVAWIITRHIASRPRSLQRAIGPSELGTACARKLGYGLAEVEKVSDTGGWRPAVGTAVHEYLAEVLANYNTASGDLRWLIELRVDVGEVDGRPVLGSADAYDRVTASVIDWKIVGPTTLKLVRSKGLAAKAAYRSQVHLYGRGMVRRGLPVERVVVAFLPSSGDLAEMVWCSEAYDESVALQALGRADAIATAMRMAGAGTVLQQLSKTDECRWCAWHDRNLGGADINPERACPGAAPPRPDSRLAGILS
jgi:hypothetical protein